MKDESKLVSAPPQHHHHDELTHFVAASAGGLVAWHARILMIKIPGMIPGILPTWNQAKAVAIQSIKDLPKGFVINYGRVVLAVGGATFVAQMITRQTNDSTAGKLFGLGAAA